VHEAIFKDGFCHHSRSFTHGEHGHELGLKICGKPGKGVGHDVGADKGGAVTVYDHIFSIFLNGDTCLAQWADKGSKKTHLGFLESESAASQGHSNHKRSCLNAISNNVMRHAVQIGNTFNTNFWSAQIRLFLRPF
jgi:hypothetical protein